MLIILQILQKSFASRKSYISRPNFTKLTYFKYLIIILRIIFVIWAYLQKHSLCQVCFLNNVFFCLRIVLIRLKVTQIVNQMQLQAHKIVYISTTLSQFMSSQQALFRKTIFYQVKLYIECLIIFIVQHYLGLSLHFFGLVCKLWFFWIP